MQMAASTRNLISCSTLHAGGHAAGLAPLELKGTTQRRGECEHGIAERAEGAGVATKETSEHAGKCEDGQEQRDKAGELDGLLAAELRKDVLNAVKACAKDGGEGQKERQLANPPQSVMDKLGATALLTGIFGSTNYLQGIGDLLAHAALLASGVSGGFGRPGLGIDGHATRSLRRHWTPRGPAWRR